MPKDPDKKNGSRGLGGQKRPGSSHTIRAKDLEGVGVFTSQGGLQKSTSVRTIDEEVTAFDNLLNDMLVEYKKRP